MPPTVGAVLEGPAADSETTTPVDHLRRYSWCCCSSESAEAVSVPLNGNKHGINSTMVTTDNN